MDAKIEMRIRLLTALMLACLGCGQSRAPTDPPAGSLEQSQKDRAALQGNWEVLSAESNGEPPPPGLLNGAEFAFSGDKLTLLGKEGTYEIDAGRSPRHIDFLRGTARQLGIYELSRDRLTLCVGPADDRPREFKTNPRTDHSLFVLKRK
ncbi:MAG: TIGR03067 domain-containing protein [Planctomycetes bacterium]|nr:TIGR03067 domain-containing protein [Planctomycetota bacterium]